MRQLSDILLDKKKEVGGYAEMARLMGSVTGQQLGQYAAGKIVPSIEFAVNWKRTFNENIIELMFKDDAPQNQVSEPPAEYGDCKDQLNRCKDKLIACMEENKRLTSEMQELKNFISDHSRAK
jgi:hypothetical protein